MHFILNKIDILGEEEIKLIDVSKEELAKYAFEISKNLKGKYVTAMDLFVSYLLLTEEETKFSSTKILRKRNCCKFCPGQEQDLRKRKIQNILR